MVRASLASVGLALALGRAGLAGEPASPVGDANFVTAIDISYSVDGDHFRRAIAGLAAAVRSPEIVTAIRRGTAGRVGFAAFVWNQHQYEVVPWTEIASAADAETVARQLEARLTVDPDAEVRRSDAFFFGRLTDVSAAMDHAAGLLAAAPIPAMRQVVNIIGNGADNMGEPAETARDRLLDAGATINGVVLDGDAATLCYYRDAVTGGPGAFVLEARDDADVVELMRRKLLGDLVAGLAAPRF